MLFQKEIFNQFSDLYFNFFFLKFQNFYNTKYQLHDG